MTQIVMDWFGEALDSPLITRLNDGSFAPSPQPRDREEIASSAARRIVGCPAMSFEYARAIILDGLNEAADIERHCADVERKVFG